MIKNRSKPLTRAAVVATAAAGLIAVTTGTAQASWHGATTGGTGSNLRTCASTSCTHTHTVSAWTNVRVVCQVRGQSVAGYYGTSDLWDYVVWEGTGKEGFAADANINTGHAYWVPGIDVCR